MKNIPEPMTLEWWNELRRRMVGEWVLGADEDYMDGSAIYRLLDEIKPFLVDAGTDDPKPEDRLTPI